MKKLIAIMALALLAVTAAHAGNELDGAIVQLQHDWAKANYHTARDQQEAAFKALADRAHQISATSSDKAEAMIWEAIVQSGYAKAKGGIGALKHAEQARDLLRASLKLNPQALQGSAYTSLGSLYYKVPRWPLGFGDKKKAREYLEKALQVNPDGIDPNYFYADFLLEQGETAKAIEYFNKALNAPARPGREDADAGRRADIEEGLQKAKQRS
ncbi:MAG: tetratricopeptide repeat protein [Methylophilaceae bacterium]